jgi:osmotically-inducible protein OsmY
MVWMIRSIGVLGAASIALAGCSTMTEPLVQLVNDSSMTTEIKTRLATEANPRTLTGIGVHTSDDMVRLTGTVADDAERRQIETIARRIAGDNRVVSDLRVATEPAAAPRAQKQ